jgi:tetratricopeptide (TPR) repeat protein
MDTLIKISRPLFFIILAFAVSSCTKEVPKDMMNNQQKSPQNQQNQQQQTQQQQMPDDDIHRNLGKNQTTDTSKGETGGDKKAEELTKAADDAEAKYQKTKSDADKKECITKQLTAANYLMFEANLSPRKKYKPALQRYRRVLELDPSHSEAKENKQQIEDIYQSMGMPIPD